MTDSNVPVPLPDSVPEEMTQEQSAAMAREQAKQNRERLRLLGFDFNLTYYLSGPMSGYPDFNYEAFTLVSNVLRGCGLEIESPHENPWPADHESMEEKELWEHMMKLCRTQMKRCHGIILLNGWPQSTGSRQELRWAIMQDWPVWFYDVPNHQILNMNRPKEI